MQILLSLWNGVEGIFQMEVKSRVHWVDNNSNHMMDVTRQLVTTTIYRKLVNAQESIFSHAAPIDNHTAAYTTWAMMPTETKEEQVEILPTPIKGRADWRSYRAFRLANGVIALAVEDRESKTTGMACLVNVGAAADPRELSGLAHFCEHMWYVQHFLL
jgi:Insulinase (Peptidase family M16)